MNGNILPSIIVYKGHLLSELSPGLFRNEASG